ncbi:hypothetical protein ACHAQH_005652 [Verticillium albo-atrum]
MADCEVCGRKFAASAHLKQHITASSVHSTDHLALCCSRCNNKVFTSVHGKLQHVLSSPKHRVCVLCPEHWDFETKAQLKHHFKIQHPGQSASNAQSDAGPFQVTDIRSPDATREATTSTPAQPQAQVHVESAPATPLDRFFLSYTPFPYEAGLPPTTSLKALIRHLGWPHRSVEVKNLRADYQKALRQEVDVWFGREDDLEAWHTLCRAVGISRPPGTIEQCTQVLRKTHVNIVDLIEWGRNRDLGSVEVFETRERLVEYSLEHGKIFPVKEVQAHGETNVVLRHLLRRFKRRRAGMERAQL